MATAALLVHGSAPASAFDPEKVFAEDKPSSGRVFRFFFSAREQGNQEEAIGALRYAAEQGNQAAQWKLGRMYQIGDGVQKDPAVAYEFFQQIVQRYGDAQPGTAAWQFTSNAMVSLGQYHRLGVPDAGIARDSAKAEMLFTTAAVYFRNPEAQFQLAKLHLDGEASRIDGIRAARMLKKATRAGHVGAEALLGHMLFQGDHIRRDAVRGLRMMAAASVKAAVTDRDWIEGIYEEALATATEEERRSALDQAGLVATQ